MHSKFRRIFTAVIAVLAIAAVVMPSAASAKKGANKTKVTIVANGGDFSGTISHKKNPLVCANEREVIVYHLLGSKPNPSVDDEVGSDTAVQRRVEHRQQRRQQRHLLRPRSRHPGLQGRHQQDRQGHGPPRRGLLGRTLLRKTYPQAGRRGPIGTPFGVQDQPAGSGAFTLRMPTAAISPPMNTSSAEIPMPRWNEETDALVPACDENAAIGSVEIARGRGDRQRPGAHLGQLLLARRAPARRRTSAGPGRSRS